MLSDMTLIELSPHGHPEDRTQLNTTTQICHSISIPATTVRLQNAQDQYCLSPAGSPADTTALASSGASRPHTPVYAGCTAT